MSGRLPSLLVAGGFLLALSSCGNPSAPTSMATLPSPMPLLAPSAVPGVAYTTRPLSVSELGKDAPLPTLGPTIRTLGFVGGRERTFQGESRHLTLVVSRFLAFKDPVGARSYLALVHSNAAAFFGGAATAQILTAEGRSGWLFTPAACACHLANPVLIGVVGAGSSVVWLEINGPDATPDLLISLLDPAAASSV